MSKNNDTSKNGLFSELRAAGLVPFAAITVSLAVAYTVGVVIWPGTIEIIGQFGDSFGALTSLFNALALAALVATVVLQSRELRETREELRKQAEAQRAYAEAAAKQLQQSERLEYLKLRPMLKVEWLRLDPGVDAAIQCRMRNVGGGPAIIEKMFVILGPTREELQNDMLDMQWESAIRRAAMSLPSEAVKGINPVMLLDSNRLLLSGEPQAIVVVALRHLPKDLLAVFNKDLKVEIHFRSLSGEDYTTTNQFNVKPVRDSAGNRTGGFHHEGTVVAAPAAGGSAEAPTKASNEGLCVVLGSS